MIDESSQEITCFTNITQPVQQPSDVPPLGSLFSKRGREVLGQVRLTRPSKSFGAVAKLSEKVDELECWSVENEKGMNTFPLKASEMICTAKSAHVRVDLFSNIYK